MMISVYLIRPQKPEVWSWIKENVDYHMVFGGGIPVEPRYIDGLIRGLIDAGFNIEEDYELIY